MKGETKTVLGEQALPGYQVVIGRNASDDALLAARAQKIGTIMRRDGRSYMVRSVQCDDLRRLIATCELIGGL